MAEVWLNAAFVCQLTGWHPGHMRKVAATKNWIHREGSEVKRNGKREREYLLSSLPRDAQVKHAQQSAIVVRPDVILEKPAVESKALAVAEKKRSIVPEKLQPMVEQRLEAIAPLVEFSKLRKRAQRHYFLKERGIGKFTELAERAAVASGNSARTLLRWFSIYRKEGEPGLAGKIRADRGTSRFFEEHGAAAAFVINERLNERFNIFHIHDLLHARWEEIGETGDKPSYNTIRRFIRAIPKPIDDLAQLGEEKFQAKHGPFLLRKAPPAMDWWISDNRTHDVMVYNTAFAHEAPGKAYRLQKTAIYDWGSRRIMACVWAPTASSRTINSALRLGIEQAGFPRNLYWDNGKDFDAVARSLTALLEASTVSITKALPFHPRSKPIESYFGWWSKRFDVLWRPAYLGNQPKSRPPEAEEAQKMHATWLAGKRESTPLPSDREFIIAALQFAVDYNDRPHSELDGKTPNQVFDEQYPQANREAIDRRILDQLFWEREQRTLRDGGCAMIGRVKYEPTDEYFPRLRALNGQEVLVCCDPFDLDQAIAIDIETGEFLGEMRIQQRIDQSPHGRETRDAIQAGMRRARNFKKMCVEYARAFEAQAAHAGWKPEREALLNRARATMTGTDGIALRNIAPGADAAAHTSAQSAQRRLPALAPSFVSDAVAADKDAFAKIELED